MAKSADAFRTISEVADWLGIQAHVLRFWESKFSQVKPIKRAGGRRYYRPNDMLLLGGIRQLLHEDGLTIKGVQKILREEGVAHVATMSQPLDELTQTQFDDSGGEMVPEAPMLDVEQNTDESAVVLSFDTGATDVVQPEQAASGPPAPVDEEPEGDLFSGLVDTPEVEQEAVSETVAETSTEPDMPPEPEVIPKAEPIAAAQEDAAQVAQPETEPESTPEAVPEPVEAAQEPAPEKAMPAQEPTTPDPEPEAPPETEAAPAAAALPAFLRRPMAEPAQTPAEPSLVEAVPAPSPEPGAPDEEKQDAPAAEAPLEEPVAEAPEVAAEPAPLPKPRIIEMPTITPIDQIKVAPAHLTAAMRTRHLTTDQAKQIAPLLDRLTHLRDAMVAHGSPPAPNSTDT